MKKLFFILLSGITIAVKAQQFTVSIKNSTSEDLNCKTYYDHGAGFEVPLVAKGTTGKFEFYRSASLFIGGVEGKIYINPVNNPNAVGVIYYDNPLIGKSSYSFSAPGNGATVIGFTNVTWMSDAHVLLVEIINPKGSKAIPVTPVIANNKNGIIRGTILWNKDDVLSPEIYPYGKAFSFDVRAPKEFIESEGPFTFERAGKYNGKSGYFQAFQPIGEVTYTTAASYDPKYVEVRYTITGVPVDLPLDIDVTTDYDKSKWTAGSQKPKPADDYTFLVGTFPSTSKSSVALENNSPVLNGVDFNCEGEWVKFDPNGNIIGGGDMVNRIASRKSSPVLPSAMLSFSASTRTSVMAIQPAATQTNQVQTKQVQGAVQKVRIKN